MIGTTPDQVIEAAPLGASFTLQRRFAVQPNPLALDSLRAEVLS